MARKIGPSEVLGDLQVVVGEELNELLARLRAAGRQVQSISVGRHNAEWIVMVRPQRQRQAEFDFVR